MIFPFVTYPASPHPFRAARVIHSISTGGLDTIRDNLVQFISDFTGWLSRPSPLRSELWP